MGDQPGEAQPARVRRFIEERRAEVLHRAVETLRSCPDDQLVAQVHRLKGTLGLYELAEAQAAVADLETLLLMRQQGASGDGSDPGEERVRVLERLQELERGGRDGSP